jgi:hypothetical protein
MPPVHNDGSFPGASAVPGSTPIPDLISESSTVSGTGGQGAMTLTGKQNTCAIYVATGVFTADFQGSIDGGSSWQTIANESGFTFPGYYTFPVGNSTAGGFALNSVRLNVTAYTGPSAAYVLTCGPALSLPFDSTGALIVLFPSAQPVTVDAVPTPSAHPLPTASAGVVTPSAGLDVVAWLSCILAAGAAPTVTAGHGIAAQCDSKANLNVNINAQGLTPIVVTTPPPTTSVSVSSVPTPSSNPLPTASAGAAEPTQGVEVNAALNCHVPAGATPNASAGNRVSLQCNANGQALTHDPAPVQPSPLYTMQVNTPAPCATAAAGVCKTDIASQSLSPVVTAPQATIPSVQPTASGLPATTTSLPATTFGYTISNNGWFALRGGGANTSGTATGQAADVNLCNAIGSLCASPMPAPTASAGAVPGAANQSTNAVSTCFYTTGSVAITALNVYPCRVTASGNMLVTTGGIATGTVATGTGNTVISAHAGMLNRVVITTAGTTGNATCYDNATTNSGTVVLLVDGTTLVSTAVAGTFIDVQMAVANGITCAGALNSPAFTVSYT